MSRRKVGSNVLALATLLFGLSYCTLVAAETPQSAPPKVPTPTLFKGPEPVTIGSPSIIETWRGESLPRRDFFRLPPGREPAPSPWIEREKKAFADILKRTQFAVLIAPMQVQAYGLDKATRSLMGAKLQQKIGREAPNPYIVQRALGEGQRTLPEEDITRLASDVGATKVLLPFAGHDGAHRLLVTIKVMERSRGSSSWSMPKIRSWQSGFSDEKTPAIVFDGMISEVLSFAGIPNTSHGEAFPAEMPSASFFPKSPQEAVRAAEGSASQRAIVLQLFGTLAPQSPSRYRERLFEESILALEASAEHGAANAGAATFLKARAFYYLNSRPAALAQLRGSDTPEARTLIEILNGNWKEAEQAAAKCRIDVLRFMLELDIEGMRTAYDVPVEQNVSPFVDSLAGKFPEWKVLLRRLEGEKSWWKAQPNLELKLALDREFPIPGFDAKSIARGLQSLGKPPVGDDIGNRVWEHVARLRSNRDLVEKCVTQVSKCVAADYLDLIEAAAISNASAGLARTYRLQGLPEAAMALAQRLADPLAGQPEYLYRVGDIWSHLAEKAAPASRQSADEASVRASSAAAFYEQGQSLTSASALYLLRSSSADYHPYFVGYSSDFPPRPYWNGDGDVVAQAKIALAYTSFDLTVASRLLMRKDAQVTEELRAELDERFRGHPLREKLLGTLGKADTSSDSEIEALERAKAVRPDLWQSYSQLALLQILNKGDYEGAARTAHAFPGFKDQSKYDPILISNCAWEAGSWFYWRGHVDEAREFYRIAAALNTGSAASLGSAQRLEVLNGNYEASATFALDRANRYNDPFAYRDYIAWLFVSGHEQEGWSAFDRLQKSFDSREVWVAADIGHRRAARRWPDLSKWLLSEPIKSSMLRTEQFALSEAVRLNAIDRRPSADLPQTLQAIEGKPRAHIENDLIIAMPSDTPPAMRAVGRSKFPGAGHHSVPEETLVPSHQYMFANALLPLRDGRYEEAVARFDDMVSYYPITGDVVTFPDATYALPYFAWASAKSGDKLGLERFLLGLPKDRREFDYFLSMAFFNGLRGDSAAAIANLQTAFNRRPVTDQRPIMSEYQWAEACDWLFDATHEQKYRDLALNWARAYQRIAPAFAWPYAFEAKLATKVSDRRRALGFALYLDPPSERIEQIPYANKEEARRWFAAHNPFKAAPAKRDGAPRASAQRASGPS